LKAVLLDRDGVLNADRPDYVKNPEEFRMLPGSAEAAARLSRAGYKIAVISNQAGVGKGLISKADLDAITNLLKQAVRDAGGKIENVYYCLHTPQDNCDCRKPKPGLILKACKEMGVEPGECIFVGDAERDVKAARGAGCESVLVLTGYADAETAANFEYQPDHIADNLNDAVDWILFQNGKV
jgi:D-glycero-D-manno-heptose 1,7-bisphosphate phosphatase